MRAIFGYCIFLIASMFLADKSNIKFNRNWKPVLFGILLQFLVAFALTNITACISAIEWVARGVMKLKDATIEGTKFCFGYIGGGDLPFDTKENSNALVFAFQVLPTIILVSTLAATLRYLRILGVRFCRELICHIRERKRRRICRRFLNRWERCAHLQRVR